METARRARHLREDLARAEARMRQTPAGIEFDLLKLRAHVGPWALRALRAGQPLHRWMGASPHNWWVESRRGVQLWHNDSTRWGDVPSLFPFEQVSHDGFETLFVLGPRYR